VSCALRKLVPVDAIVIAKHRVDMTIASFHPATRLLIVAMV
jgi:hypothetical protein